MAAIITTVTNIRAVLDGKIRTCHLRISEGRIQGILPPGDAYGRVIDGHGMLALPGLIDAHIHGGWGVDLGAVTSPREVRSFRDFCASHGVTFFLPTLSADTEEHLLRAASAIGSATCPQIAGIHLEGPFLAEGWQGSHISKKFLREPDYDLFQRIQEAYARYSDVLLDCMEELVAYSERRVRAVVSTLPDGEYCYTDYVDGCGEKYPDPLPICVKVTIAGENLTVDFTGSAAQIKAPINVPYPCTKAAVFFSVKALMGDDIPANEGINRAVRIIAPEGCIVNPTEPSPVGAQIDCSQRIPDAIFGALAPLFPDTVVTAGNGACTTTILAGDGVTGTDSVFIFHEVIAGGGGASRRFDGLSGVQVNMTNTSNMPIEATEMEFPKILARCYELKEDTGGPGEYRGGLGIQRELEILQSGVLYTGLGDRHRFHPWGLAGGGDGSAGAFYRIAGDNGSVSRMGHKTTSFPLKKGDIIRVITPGAGGYGNPRKRPPEKVLQDVLERKVSLQAAREQYAVVIRKEGEHIFLDKAMTSELRKDGERKDD